MVSHVSDQDVGGYLSCPSKGDNGWGQREERRPAGGGLISRPTGRSVWWCFWSPRPSSMGGGWCNGGAVGGEDAPVGKGPRRTRPHPGARTKYIAPVEVHGGGSASGFLETGGL
ncbi:MAG: hypothetical protein ACJ788_08530 [Ktedonobacteraceae bacterium]